MTCIPSQIRADDSLPKAICHDCLQQVGALHLYAVKVEKTQKFLEFHRLKTSEDKRDMLRLEPHKLHPIIATLSVQNIETNQSQPLTTTVSAPNPDYYQADALSKGKLMHKKKSQSDFMEALSLEEFAQAEKLDKKLLSGTTPHMKSTIEKSIRDHKREQIDFTSDTLDPIVLIDGKPAKQGAALDKQITLFYKMECCICHEKGFHFRSLMRHYKDRHGVPGYVTCCDKKFHYFYPKKIIEHMAFHLQPNIFM